MKRISLFLLSLSLLATNVAHAQDTGDEQGLEIPGNLQLPQDKEALRKAYGGWWAASQKNRRKRMKWYNEAKFGCFIHWGVYSVPAGIWKGKRIGGYTEHLMRAARIPIEQYKEELVKTFNPVGFDADEWMQHAADAGMKYFIITAKHHDGMAMYYSDAYPYDIRNTAFGRDPMAELREAARKRGIKFGFYYSQAFDWEHPDAPGNDWDYPTHPGGDKLLGGRDWWLEMPQFLENADRYVTQKSIPQIQELIRKYDPDILWFDTPHKLPFYQNIRILEAIRQADPKNKIVVNGRLAEFADTNLGDYRNTGDRAAYFYPVQGDWESIPTTNESYGYSKTDTLRKAAVHFVRLLATATSKGGNILMNVGPRGNGQWDAPDVALCNRIGDWLKVNGEAIYGNTRTALPVQNWGVTTQKDGITYLHVYNWPRNGRLTIGGLTSQVAKVWFLSDPARKDISVAGSNGRDLTLKLPAQMPDNLNTVIALKLKKEKAPYPVRLLEPGVENILPAFDATLSDNQLKYGDGKPHRNYVNNWKSNAQNLKWKVRLNEPATYRIHLRYNTASPQDSGTVTLHIDGKATDIAYTPYTERQGTNALPAGEIRLQPGEYEIVLDGKEYEGKEYMRPIALRFTVGE